MALPKIKTASELRSNLYESLTNVSSGDLLIITHKSGDSVILSKEKYDQILEDSETQKSIMAGLQEFYENKVYSNKEAFTEFDAIRNKWKSKK